MHVLAFDPGYDRLGVAVLERKDGKDVLIHSECLVTDRNTSMHDRLFHVGERIESLLVKYEPVLIALETLFFNKNQKTGIAVAEVRGIIIYLGKRTGCDVVEYSPQQVKVAVTGYGASDKQAVTAMVRRLVKNVPEKALDDEYDAIAVGITALASMKTQ